MFKRKSGVVIIVIISTILIIIIIITIIIITTAEKIWKLKLPKETMVWKVRIQKNYYMRWIGRYNSGWYPRFFAERTRLPNGLESQPNELELQPNGLESSPNGLPALPNELENSPNELESGRMDSRDL